MFLADTGLKLRFHPANTAHARQRFFPVIIHFLNFGKKCILQSQIIVEWDNWTRAKRFLKFPLYNYGKKFPFDCMLAVNGDYKMLATESNLIFIHELRGME